MADPSHDEVSVKQPESALTALLSPHTLADTTHAAIDDHSHGVEKTLDVKKEVQGPPAKPLIKVKPLKPNHRGDAKLECLPVELLRAMASLLLRLADRSHFAQISRRTYDVLKVIVYSQAVLDHAGRTFAQTSK